MTGPIAYTYDADTHCPDCAVARFGLGGLRGRHGLPLARDAEGNPIGAIFPWDEWHEPSDITPGVVTRHTLACGTCGDVMDSCVHGAHILPDPAAVRDDMRQSARDRRGIRSEGGIA